MKKLFAVFAGLLLLCNLAWAAVNLNTATPQQLEALKGIGPAKAKAIVDYRTKNGPFKTVDDLKKVSGIGDKTLESLRKEVTVGGATPAAKPAAANAKPAAAKPAAK
ncbi:helix-hairpin-helix domain-containing protein [Chromobacterium vaccinii]|uniref:ComEA family DNA-binding protein n=1 Tax=Chromobacterium vaccinii TaxID=1108595 RepID=UPI001E471BE6|nr:helix-hairpin-helix domain-containing protein [Chromobacterium vaccinii]MCD4483170.1 helix-hairpin-helix domain-containing protein [Chromobacterium vaccinii]